jgi:exodeoxyribonuclease VII small subunit
MTARKRASGSAVDFEKSLKQLEAIVKRLEEEEVSLEVSIKLFEQGQALVQACEKQLRAAENQVRMLVQTDSGKVEEAELPEGRVPETNEQDTTDESKDLPPDNETDPQGLPF